MPRLIALYSPCMHSGKSTVSNLLTTEYGHMTIKFAQTLKDMVALLLCEAGYNQRDIERCIEGDLKEKPTDFGPTPRQLMQTLGYEWGQKCVHPALWVKIAEGQINAQLSGGEKVVIDDLRYPQEYKMLQSLGAQFWHISRPGAQDSTGHHSEGLLNDHEWDVRIVNKDGIEELKGTVRDLLAAFV
jgi:hypothetical protein